MVPPAPDPSPLREALRRLRRRTFLSPWPVRSCGVTFSDGVAPVTLELAIKRDQPVTEQEKRWLTLAVSKRLDQSVALDATTTPLLPDLLLVEDGLPDAAGRKELTLLKEIMAKRVPVHLVISYPKGNRKVAANNLKRAVLLQDYLEREFTIPAERINLKRAGKAYRITVLEDEVL